MVPQSRETHGRDGGFPMTEPLSLFRSFRAKILLGYGAALAVTALIFVWSIVNLLTLGRAADSILRENYKSILAAEHMINNIERQDSFCETAGAKEWVETDAASSV